MMYIYEMAAIFDFFIMPKANIPFLSTLKKPETQPLEGVSNLTFFCTIYIYKMAAIFLSFDNGQC